MNLPLEYIKYCWKAKKRHGIHSPFVYKMSDECLSIQIAKEDKQMIQTLIKSLKQDHRVIQFDDFGAGSKSMNKFRTVSSILKNSSSKGKFALLLYQLAKFYKPMKILELGTSLGVGTIHLAKGNPLAKITTIEACHEVAEIAEENFTKTNVNNVAMVMKTFDGFLRGKNESYYDLLFIDGHHDGGALLHYIDVLEKNMHDDTFLILDDIRWSESMCSAWKKLCSDSRFSVSIDFFRMGVLIKKPTQRKEHFVLKL